MDIDDSDGEWTTEAGVTFEVISHKRAIHSGLDLTAAVEAYNKEP